jgi:5-oxoprolinase (ATP-hydrolysing) subunit A
MMSRMPLAIPAIDLNADAGESFGRYRLGDDERLLRVVTSVSVACGWHAGDPGVIRATLGLARACGVSAGAHPSFPDRQGFGRREMQMASDDLRDAVIYQVAAVAGMAAVEGVRLQHVKAHGALYNMACREPRLAAAVVGAVAALDRSLAIYALPDSALARAAEAAGLPVIAEGFLDRHYEDDGRLTPRGHPDAVIDDAKQAAARAVEWLRTGAVISRTGTPLPLRVSALCVHGDTDGAVALATAVRRAIEAAGVRLPIHSAPS